MRWRVLAAVMELVAFACGVVALAKHDDAEITVLKGAEFEKGWTSYAPLDHPGRYDAFQPFDFGNPHLWLGAAVALALSGAVILVLSLQRRRGPTTAE